MQRRVVVPGVDAQLVPSRFVEITDGMVFPRGETEKPMPGRIARDMALVDGRNRKLNRDMPVGVAHRLLVRRVERRLVLIDEDAVSAQRLEAGTVELAGEKPFDGTIRIGRVDYDEVVFLFLAADIAQTFFEPDFDAAILEFRRRERQILLREQHHLPVDFDEIDRFDGPVFDELAHGAAVAAADDENVFDVGMDRHRHVGDHLVVDELVLLGDHKPAVEYEHASESGRVENIDLLNGAFLGRELFRHLHRKAHVIRMFVGIPEFHGILRD